MVPQQSQRFVAGNSTIQSSFRVSRRSLMRIPLGAWGIAVLSGVGRDASAHPMASPSSSPGVVGSGKTREYFIAADEVDWDYAPSGMDMVTGMKLEDEQNASVFTIEGPNRIGRIYRKAQYRAYSDETFSTLLPVTSDWKHLGILGPVIRAEVGDTLVVHFLNNTGFPASMHPHGVRYDKANEGAPYEDGTSRDQKLDAAVAPGDTYTYTWTVPERSGPGSSDLSSVIWMYHSHTNEIPDTLAGLVGPIIITRQGQADADAVPVDVDREFVTLFTIFDENASPYLKENFERTGSSLEQLEDEDEFEESNLMHSINGFVYGNLPGLEMNVGERVRWYVVGMGNEVDLHTPHWHGQTVEYMGMRMDMVELLPMSMLAVDMVPDEPGTWMYHCHVNDHLSAGMIALFTVDP